MLQNEPMRLDEAMKQPASENKPMRLGDAMSMQTESINLPETESLFEANGFVNISDKMRRQWLAKGPIKAGEASVRQDKSELLPFNPEAAAKSVKLINAVNRLKSGNYEGQEGQQSQDLNIFNEYVMNVEEIRTRGMSIGGQITKGVMHLPAFMIEFLTTGGAYTAGKKILTKSGTKAVEKFASSTANRIATKVADAAGQSVIRTALMPHRVVESAADRMVDANLAWTDKGAEIAQTAAESPFTSVAKGMADIFIENLSEVSGGALTAGFKKASKAFPVGFSTGVKKLWTKLHPNEAVEKLFTKAGFNGFLEEMGEERVGALMRAVLGVEDFGADDPDSMFDRIVSSIPDGEQLLVEAGIFSFPGATRAAIGQLRGSDRKSIEPTKQDPSAPAKSSPERDALMQDLQAEAQKYETEEEFIEAMRKRSDVNEEFKDDPDSGIISVNEDIRGNENFQKFFEGSQVVDESGKPLIVYHGTDSKIEIFDQNNSGKGSSKLGFFFTDDAEFSENFGDKRISAYVNIKNPKTITSEAWDAVRLEHGTDSKHFEEMKRSLVQEGFDGIIVEGKEEIFAGEKMKARKIIVPFESNQIKSIDNQGTFDPNDPSILREDIDYRMDHQAPTNDGYNKPGHDLEGIYPDDIYSSEGYRYYGDGDISMDRESASIIASMRGKPNKKVKIYRAVPKIETLEEEALRIESEKKEILRTGKAPSSAGNVNSSRYYDQISDRLDEINKIFEENDGVDPTEKIEFLNPGDWVSINRKYAISHGKSHLENYKIISRTVPAKHIYTDGNSLHEWGYDPRGLGEVRESQLTLDEFNDRIVEGNDEAIKAEHDVAFGSQEEFQKAIDKAARDIKKAGDDFSKIKRLRSEIADLLKRRGFVDTRGLKAETSADIADIAALFRHPNIEQLQAIFLKNGVVVGHQIVTSGSVASVSVDPDRYAQQLKSTKVRLEADQVYLAHNHPSGNPKPSKADLDFTGVLNRKIPIAGHVILDGDEFTLMTIEGVGIRAKRYLYDKRKTDFTANTMYFEAKTYMRKQKISILYLDSDARVIGLDNIRPDANLNETIKNGTNRFFSSGYLLIYDSNEVDMKEQFKSELPNGLAQVVEVKNGRQRFLGDHRVFNVAQAPRESVASQVQEEIDLRKIFRAEKNRREIMKGATDEFIENLAKGTDPNVPRGTDKGAVAPGVRKKIEKMDDRKGLLEIAREGLESIRSINKFLAHRINKNANPDIKEELADLPKRFLTTNKNGLSADEALNEINNADLGVRFDSVSDMVGFLEYSVERENELREEIRDLKPIMKRRSDTALLNDKVRQFKKGAVRGFKKGLKKGESIGRTQVKDLQRDLIKIIDQSNLELKDKAKFIKTVKNTQTVDQFEKTLPKVIDRIDRLETRASFRKLKDKIKKELKNLKPTKQSGKPVGKFTPETQKILDDVAMISTMTREQAKTEIENNLKEVGKGDGEFDLGLRNRMLDLFAGFDEMDNPEKLRELLDEIQTIKATGKAGKLLSDFARKEEVAQMVSDAINVIQGDKPVGEQLTSAEMSRLEQMVKGFFIGQMGWQDKMDILSMHDSESTQDKSKLSQMTSVSDEITAEKKGVRESTEAFVDMAAKAFGFNGDAKMIEKLVLRKFHEDSQRIELGSYINNRGRSVDLNLTKAEARKIWMELQDPSLQESLTGEEQLLDGVMIEHIKGNAYSRDMISAIRNFLTAEDKKFVKVQMEFYREYYKGVNEVYRRVYGVDLPFNEFYSPIRREGFKVDGQSEFFEDIGYRKSVAPGSTKSRQENLAKIKVQSDLEVMQKHIMEMEHFKNWVFKLRDINSIFNDADVREVIDRKFGSPIMLSVKSHIQDFTRNSGEKAKWYDWFVDMMRVHYTQAALAIKPALTLKQMVSFTAYAETIPVSDFSSGVAEFLSDPKKAIDILMQSELMKNRSRDFTRDVKDAFNSVEFAAFRKIPSFKNKLMFTTRWGDKGAIFLGGYSVYKYRLSQGDTHEQALKEFDAVTARTQQSGDIDQQSDWQRGGVFPKLFTMFTSSQNQYMRREISAIRNLMNGRISPEEAAKKIAIYHFILPMTFQLISDFGVWDEDEQLRAAVLGSFNGVFILKDFLDTAVRLAINAASDDADLGIFNNELPIYDSLRGIEKAFNTLDVNDIMLEDVIEASFELAEGTVAPLTGLPMKQLMNTYEGFQDIADGEIKRGLLKTAGWSPFRVDQIIDEEE